jgi:hypothetical protein
MPSHPTQFTNTNIEICRSCKIPQIVNQVNCLNLSVGKQNVAVYKGYGNIAFPSQGEHYIDCPIYPFENPDDFNQKCSESCPSYRPIHRSLSNEECISIEGFDANGATDSQLRQSILTILYQYHARHPERFYCFDITPEFLGKCLGITIQDVVRVIAPMEEEGEVSTKRYAHDMHFSYVAIRSKGIRMIDDEPLFERLNTIELRTEMNFHGPTYGPAGTVQGNQSILEKD